jgi:hypothetical protein
MINYNSKEAGEIRQAGLSDKIECGQYNGSRNPKTNGDE